MELVAAGLGVCALLLVVAMVVGLYVSRQRTLSQRVGSFSCLYRKDVSPEAAWSAGIAQYTAGRLVWWRTLSLAPRPAYAWSRADLTLVERTALGELDEAGYPLLRVLCQHGTETFEMILSVPACAGLVSWLEAGPRPVGRVL